MTHGIYVEPNSADYPCTPDQYAAAEDKLKLDSRVSGLTITGNTGSATVEGVDFSWSYDGAAALILTIVKKHGFLASHYPNASIFDALEKQLGVSSYQTGNVQ